MWTTLCRSVYFCVLNYDQELSNSRSFTNGLTAGSVPQSCERRCEVTLKPFLLQWLCCATPLHLVSKLWSLSNSRCSSSKNWLDLHSYTWGRCDWDESWRVWSYGHDPVRDCEREAMNCGRKTAGETYPGTERTVYVPFVHVLIVDWNYCTQCHFHLSSWHYGNGMNSTILSIIMIWIDSRYFRCSPSSWHRHGTWIHTFDVVPSLIVA